MIASVGGAVLGSSMIPMVSLIANTESEVAIDSEEDEVTSPT